MTIRNVRSVLYNVARILGDFSAIYRVPKAATRRLGRRAAGKVTGRLFRRIFK